MQKNSRAGRRIMAVLLFLGPFGPANAQIDVATDPDVTRREAPIEEVIVTAQKRQQRLQDVPMSVFAVTDVELEAAMASDLVDLSYMVPGLWVGNDNPTGGPGIGLVTIRGVGNSRGPSSLVGMYLDESAVTGFPTSQVDLRVLDLERVEVLRGPQGTLYGGGSVGGTIRFITKDPQLDELTGWMNVMNSSTREGGANSEVTAVVDVPVVSDVFGLRISGTFADESGWIDQPDAGRSNINDNQVKNARIKSLWRITDALDIKGTVVIHRADAGANNTVNLSQEESTVLYAVDPTNTNTGSHDDYELYSLTASYDFGVGTLLAASTFLNMDQSHVSTQIIKGPSGLEININGWRQNELTTHELRWNSDDGGPFIWTVGLFRRDWEQNLQRNSFLLTRTTGVLANNTPDNTGTAESWAAFGDVSYRFTDRLEIGTGIRYAEEERVDVNNNNGSSLSGKFDAATPRVYLSYRLTPDVMLYGSISEGFRSGGNNGLAVRAAGGPPTFGPETLTAYELGTKMSTRDGRLSGEVAVYHGKYTDIQSDSFNLEILRNVTSNIGEGEISGVEWSLRWRPNDAFLFSFNGNYVDTEIIDISGAVGTSHIVGDPLDFVPEYNYSILGNYSFDWSSNVSGFVRLALNEVGESTRTQRASDHFDPQGQSDVLTFLDLRLGAQWGNWSTSIFGNNLLDEHGYSSPYVTNSASAQPRRRTIGLMVGYAFD